MNALLAILPSGKYISSEMEMIPHADTQSEIIDMGTWLGCLGIFLQSICWWRYLASRLVAPDPDGDCKGLRSETSRL